MSVELLRCSSCREYKPKSAYHRRRDCSRGYNYFCKKCKWEKSRASKQARARELLQNAKSRARVTITKEWVLERLEAGHCEVTGVPFVFLHERHPHAPSLDRRDPSKGYTPENTRLVTTHLNVALNSWRDEQLEVLSIAFLRRRRPDLFVTEMSGSSGARPEQTPASHPRSRERADTRDCSTPAQAYPRRSRKDVAQQSPVAIARRQARPSQAERPATTARRRPQARRCEAA